MTSSLTPALPERPRFKKKILSLFIRNHCERQARLYMYPDKNREPWLPVRQQARSGAGLVGAAGDEWQDKKVAEVETIFGKSNVIAQPPKPGKVRPASTDFATVLSTLMPYQFVIEAEFQIEHEFKTLYNLHGLKDEFGGELEVGSFIPDIIQVGPARKSTKDAFAMEVTAEGKLERIDDQDERLQLRVIDVKLASEPGANYFAEIVYYSVALALWLTTQPDGHRFAVTANAAIWPGSYEQSALALRYEAGRSGVAATAQELMVAMEEDLEKAEFGVYLPRLNRFMRFELPQLLSTPWQDLEWHPNFRCQSCDFLGYAWPGKVTHRPNHCWQIAESSDLHVRAAGMTAVTARLIKPVASTIPDLAALHPDSPVFDESQALRLKRKVLPARAEALQMGKAFAIPGTGSSAAQPSYVDLELYVFLDYDPSSAITACVALRGRWREPRKYGDSSPTQRQTRDWDELYTVAAPTVPAEEQEILKLLRRLQEIFDEVSCEDAKLRLNNPDAKSRYQIYVWDEAQYRHLTRLMGRHLQAIVSDPKLRGLAWLFPPEDVLPEPDYASRTSPISMVSTTVENHVAVPVPHHYTLFEVAQHWLPTGLTPPYVDPFYREPLTNLIPAERLYEFWNHKGNWANTLDAIRKSTRGKTLALSFIVSRLKESGSGITLAKSAAPPLPTPKVAKDPITVDGNLWHQHSLLNGKLQEIEVETTYALPPQEREAKFRAAHLLKRLSGSAYTSALEVLNNQSGLNMTPAQELLIYKLSPNSRDVRFKPGDFALALSPRDQPLFLNQSAESLLPGSGKSRSDSVQKVSLTGVSIKAIDREGLLIALEADPRSRILELQSKRIVDFSGDLMLDITHLDTITRKVESSLRAIGEPTDYVPLSSKSSTAVAKTAKAAKRQKAPSAPHDFLYFAGATQNATISRDLQPLEAALKQAGATLNDSQWDAWKVALSRRLTLIWGPPGTGKSQTLRAIISSAVLDAQRHGKSLRIMVTANNYTAIDNILLKLETALGTTPGVSLCRVQSSKRPVDAVLARHPGLKNLELNMMSPSKDILDLRQKLTNLGDGVIPPEVVIIGMPNQQAHNLAVAGKRSPSYGETLKSWFDLVIIDEASQLDVAGSTLIFGKMAPNSTCILAGDHLQLPPIHQAEPPKDLGGMVESIYDFMYNIHGIKPQPLLTSYRSNAEIVEFVRQADYPTELVSHSPHLKMNVVYPLPVVEPSDWPTTLAFSPVWAELLRPDRAAICVVYEDGTSGQSNDFEAQSVAALLRTLYSKVGQPKNRNNANGNLIKDFTTPYTGEEFWKHAVGVVAPHRAQGSNIVGTLHRAFIGTSTSMDQIRAAVDTVERYQGQERDIIVASIGLGDPDAIASEDEFLFNLNRFNVLVSRAATKAIVFVTRSLLDHLSNDQDVIHHSRLIKDFAETFCEHQTSLRLPYIDGSKTIQHKEVVVRYHS